MMNRWERRTVIGNGLGRLGAGVSSVAILAAIGASGCNDHAARPEPIRAETKRVESKLKAVGGGLGGPTSAEACVTIQRGGGEGNVFDSGINNNGVSSNGGSGMSGTIPIGDSGSPATARQELMNFDLSPITNLNGAGYTVLGSQVSLYFCPGSAGQTINVHQATQSWGASPAQFSTYEDSVSWPSFNESYVATPFISFNTGAANGFPGCVGTGHTPSNTRFDMTSLVSEWLNGTATQDGIVLEQPPVAGVSTIALSSDYPPALSGYHPTLFVCYTVTCQTGTADCNDNGLDGCETSTTTVQNCGGCGDACNLANATPACVNQACAIAACNPGYGDCDGNPANGCEQPLPCGNGQSCTSNAQCSSGVCTGASASGSKGGQTEGTCAAPTCTDGVKNGSEGDVDCGGSCPPCVNGDTCNVNADCASGQCTAGLCVTKPYGGVQAFDLVCGGSTAASVNYSGVATIGEPAGASVASSQNYGFRGGFVGVTQGGP
jgi:hypothetical protein